MVRKAGKLYLEDQCMVKTCMFSPKIVVLIINLSWEFYCYFLVRSGEVSLKDENEELLPTAFAVCFASVP